SLEKAQKLGIMYIISDYDINLYKQELQVSHINYFAFDKEISIPFKPKYSSLSQIRILPATYNRNNICSIHVAIFDEGNELAEQNIPCRDIRNNMYYTSAMPLNLETDKSYTLKLSTNATQNNIGLYGSEKDRPFVQLLFQEGAKTYPLVYQDKYYFLWKVPGLKQIQDNKYNPIWFLIGLSTTLVTAFFYFTYLAKKEFNFGFFKRLDKKRKFMARNAADISLCYHALVFLVGLTISAAIFVVLTQLFPIHFIMPDTTAINWYTVHHYPRQQDYFYFFGGFVIVVIGSFSMWVIWIWKKRK
ncbi:MAG TPA: hypothetical protein VLF68_01855, partial [Candidatus Saccharimonadales bacterium]|nr:hypothetical protein [Candidatus Saccharimonadales bacterium]